MSICHSVRIKNKTMHATQMTKSDHKLGPLIIVTISAIENEIKMLEKYNVTWSKMETILGLNFSKELGL